ncbi:MAG: ABC transporter substrate-binding protein [Caldicoprobacterales bacterium]|jgi:raffinose/stachyose/melibiose transport system substrate-binding protein|nr:carbohydrate ABC transporter substrate-binding protein [Clostridiales bacterium]
MKRVLVSLLALLMIFSLVACAGTPTTPPDATKQPDTPDTPGNDTGGKEPVTIESWIVQTDWLDSWDVMKQRFEDEYSWIEVLNVGTGEVGIDFFTTRLASKDIPEIVQVDNRPLYYTAVDEGWLQDLSGREVAKHIPDAYKEAYTYNGVLFGITQGAAFSVLYLNMDILGQAGWTEPPTNWDEFIQCCKDIQEKTDAAPFTMAGDKTTTNWMPFEIIIANAVGEELGFGVYEEKFKNGSFDFTAWPEITEKLAEMAAYAMPGTASYTEDDVTAIMGDGSAAMCFAGNWTANNIVTAISEVTGSTDSVLAVVPPLNNAGKGQWTSVSPETAFGLSNEDDSEAKVEAREIFFDWVFEPENFAIIQNARGTVPVLTNMSEDLIKLPEPIAANLTNFNNTPYVLMGFNLWTTVFEDSANTGLRDVYSGNKDAATVVQGMTATLSESYVEAGD